VAETLAKFLGPVQQSFCNHAVKQASSRNGFMLKKWHRTKFGAKGFEKYATIGIVSLNLMIFAQILDLLLGLPGHSGYFLKDLCPPDPPQAQNHLPLYSIDEVLPRLFVLSPIAAQFSGHTSK
jgi:hypothetical protein